MGTGVEAGEGAGVEAGVRSEMEVGAGLATGLGTMIESGSGSAAGLVSRSELVSGLGVRGVVHRPSDAVTTTGVTTSGVTTSVSASLPPAGAGVTGGSTILSREHVASDIGVMAPSPLSSSLPPSTNTTLGTLPVQPTMHPVQNSGTVPMLPVPNLGTGGELPPPHHEVEDEHFGDSFLAFWQPSMAG